MSRVATKPVDLPQGVSVTIAADAVTMKGAKGSLTLALKHGLKVVQEDKTLEALTAARGFIRHELLERMGVRHVPELSFQIDKSKDLKLRIDELLGRNKKNQPVAVKAGSGKARASAKLKQSQ